jgi:hypothetical protein
MTNNILTLAQLATVTGGGSLRAPLSGDVKQDINTNWGGSQTNIGTQVINEAPKQPTTITEYMRTNPAARLEMIRRGSAVHHEY